MIEAINATSNFVQSNSDGLFIIIGVVIGTIGAYLIAESGQKKVAKSIRRNTAQGYLIEIEQLEQLIDRVLADVKGALPKTVPIYSDSGMFLTTRKETLQFSLELYKKISEFYNFIIKAEYHHRESHNSMKEGLREYEARRLALADHINAISTSSGKILPDSERDKMFEDLKTTSLSTGQIAFSDTLRIDIKREFIKAKRLIPELKTLLKKEMD